MSYGYDYLPGANGDRIIGVILMAVVIWLLALAFSLVCYIFESLGVYTIAKRRTIKHPWLAWIPVANLWTLGCISDQYRYVARGKVTNRRKLLLGLAIVTAVLLCVVWGGYGNVMIRLLAYGDRLNDMSEEQLMRTILMPVMRMAGVGVVTSVLAIVQSVFQYIALYDLYTSCDPNNNVLFLVLSILFSVVRPFFIFACRNKDLGMPPRRPVIPEQQPPWRPVNGENREPWEQNQK